MSIYNEFMKIRTRLDDVELDRLRSAVEAEYYRRMEREKNNVEVIGK